MNRCVVTDSKLSLDADSRISDSAEMIAQPYSLYVERTDATRNMARYYAMEISVTLFGEACLTRSWGRIGKSGQRMTHYFKREEDAVGLFLNLLRQKRARGYRPAGPGICKTVLANRSLADPARRETPAGSGADSLDQYGAVCNGSPRKKISDVR